jgi:hypothetical protein
LLLVIQFFPSFLHKIEQSHVWIPSLR